jgi:hypothetical protein
LFSPGTGCLTFAQEEEMFRSIVKAVAKKVARRKKPAAGGSPPVSPCPEVNDNGTPENAAIPDRSRSVSEKEISRRAYLKWEAAGKPKGNDSRFWLEAKEELLQGE